MDLHDDDFEALVISDDDFDDDDDVDVLDEEEEQEAEVGDAGSSNEDEDSMEEQPRKVSWSQCLTVKELTDLILDHMDLYSPRLDMHEFLREPHDNTFNGTMKSLLVPTLQRIPKLRQVSLNPAKLTNPTTARMACMLLSSAPYLEVMEIRNVNSSYLMTKHSNKSFLPLLAIPTHDERQSRLRVWCK